ncbi:MAG TPA: tRNA uridine-5-carboxymethylaminomethyl(34) synthesis enzyme MnmG [Thiotrichales bacterium]|nr:tRNA uridine-5-carboxymethylaminomethyl(34) synthesis enzyme MnmG [Thiotrichales bacterium]
MRAEEPIVVVGGGHAGLEAAHAACRMGMPVTLLTLHRDSLARLSCNPAIGGIGKSHLVREIDALGGLMARAADAAGIHFRVLNASRGPAVQGPRIQQDLEAYPRAIRALLANSSITIREAEVVDLRLRGGRVTAVVTGAGEVIEASAVILTSGTFLGGRLFRGEQVYEGGRAGEAAATALSSALRRNGLKLERFKTGTPPRILADSIDHSAVEVQPGDEQPVPLSFENLAQQSFVPALPQRVTHIAHSTGETHDLVRANLNRSPLYTGKISSHGPRYCPSFEDKVVRFPDRDQHLFHLEPMGLEHPWVYINGMSTSLPEEIQERMVRSVPGLENAVIARHGYAVEYDYAPPTQLRGSLEVRALPGLFLAGQICGTTGYEEAAALGLVAGANAVLAHRGLDPWIPSRLESYLGVLVDDLTLRGVLEPYRMFTSRAEMRLSLAPDTADRRLADLGRRLGLIDQEKHRRAKIRWQQIDRALADLDPGEKVKDTPGHRIRRGEAPLEVLEQAAPHVTRWPRADLDSLVAAMRYRGYLEIEKREARRLERLEAVPIPEDFTYKQVPGLSHEIRQRLEESRPTRLGQAARIPGVTPAALALLASALVRGERAAS